MLRFIFWVSHFAYFVFFIMERCFVRSFNSLRKQSNFATPPLFSPTKLRLKNERRFSILMTRYYPDVSSAADWLKQIFSQTDLGSDASLGWSF